MYAAEKLIEIEDEFKRSRGENKVLNKVEVDELEFYMEEYFYEYFP